MSGELIPYKGVRVNFVNNLCSFELINYNNYNINKETNIHQRPTVEHVDKYR